MVSGDNVTVLRQEVGFVRVNGLKSPLPLSLSSGGMRLSQRGWSVAVETNFSLSLLYNWDQLVVVTLPSFYADVCGLCGNNNGDPSDDLETPDGSQASIPAFSWSWKVDNGDPSCQADCSGPCVSCKPYIASRYSTDSFCGLLSSKDGPFGGCNAVVNPNIYDKICVNDLCINDGNQTFLCRAVEAYAAACQIKGLDTLDWRNRTRCYLQCPMFSHYEPCGSSCTATCANPNAPSGCQSSCVESCQCDVGFLLSADECVPRGQCGCSYQGSYYPANYTFWADDQCQQRCTCDPQTNQLTCTQSSCKPLESCGLVGGVRGCQAIAVQSCLSEGGRHYVTFDGLAYDFQGSCVYHLAVLCSLSTNLTAFAVQIFKGIEDTAAVTVIIHMYGVAMEISSDRSGKIKVDGVFKDLPYNLNTDQVMLYDTGLLVFMQTNFGLSLTLDVHNRLTLAVPSVYSGSLCGLCGNYNGNSTDDLTTRNGQLAADPFEFGKSWKARDVPGCVDGCKGPCAVCSETQKQMFLGTGYCGKLTDPAGPFRDCHGTVDPARILQNCVSDACVHKSIQYVLCQSFAYYVAACQDLGAKVYKWRTSSFCTSSQDLWHTSELHTASTAK
ncbi:IgGFc-binding protein-like [Amia ocellicauda]|uniref:IgGFc-binding protein-like n=1 Tax=Amia ocellicauda TaxID=2972642 RepID=UPI0034638F2F